MDLLDCYYAHKYGKVVQAALRKNNEIYVGKTNSDCFKQRPIGELRGAEQGFITEKDYFVNRKIALRIARHYKQFKYKHPPFDELMSEDLLYREEN